MDTLHRRRRSSLSSQRVAKVVGRQYSSITQHLRVDTDSDELYVIRFHHLTLLRSRSCSEWRCERDKPLAVLSTASSQTVQIAANHSRMQPAPRQVNSLQVCQGKHCFIPLSYNSNNVCHLTPSLLPVVSTAGYRVSSSVGQSLHLSVEFLLLRVDNKLKLDYHHQPMSSRYIGLLASAHTRYDIACIMHALYTCTLCGCRRPSICDL